MAGKSDYLEMPSETDFQRHFRRFCSRLQPGSMTNIWLRAAYRRSARFRNANIERGADSGLRHLYLRGGCSNERRDSRSREQRFPSCGDHFPTTSWRTGPGNEFLLRGAAHRRGEDFSCGDNHAQDRDPGNTTGVIPQLTTAIDRHQRLAHGCG